eukprot:TRINITY_DN698_c0_g1_i4.p1 TRINITY_DN698_c0_g1~~TRINITY_DN698_c0_g1_i4.p1  ORF type:complete len:216 (+),score=38.54 TRINITY_DN698_c0_g1_i4:163-810(+)
MFLLCDIGTRGPQCFLFCLYLGHCTAATRLAMAARLSLLGVLVTFMCLAGSSLAETMGFSIKKDGRKIIPFGKFGFDKTGHIEMNISHVVIYTLQFTQQAKMGQMGFFITTLGGEMELQQEIEKGLCVLDSPYIDKLYTLQDWDNNKDANDVYHFKYKVPEADEFNLFFASCQPHASVNMDFVLKFYNVEANNNMDFLPAGKTVQEIYEAPLLLL